MAIQEIYLIRHGETEWSLKGRHTGSTDIPLTENGRRMGMQLKPFLNNKTFVLVLTSPLVRARETCELAGFGDRARIDSDLKEWNYGDYEGLTRVQILETRPEWLLFRDGAPNGETPEQVATRVDRVIAKVRAAEGDVIVFAHGHLLRTLAARWIGLLPAVGAHLLLDTSTVSILSYNQGIPAVKEWNAPVSGPFQGT